MNQDKIQIQNEYLKKEVINPNSMWFFFNNISSQQQRFLLLFPKFMAYVYSHSLNAIILIRLEERFEKNRQLKLETTFTMFNISAYILIWLHTSMSKFSLPNFKWKLKFELFFLFLFLIEKKIIFQRAELSYSPWKSHFHD